MTADPFIVYTQYSQYVSDPTFWPSSFKKFINSVSINTCGSDEERFVDKIENGEHLIYSPFSFMNELDTILESNVKEELLECYMMMSTDLLITSGYLEDLDFESGRVLKAHSAVWGRGNMKTIDTREEGAIIKLYWHQRKVSLENAFGVQMKSPIVKDGKIVFERYTREPIPGSHINELGR